MTGPLSSVCPDCGTPFERIDTAARCHACHPDRSVRPSAAFKGSPESRGYDRTWRKLSRRARALQPFCSDCGSVHDLTADHTPQAWQRRASGVVIRLEDIDVVCRRCNAERGAARGANVTEHHDAGALSVLVNDLNDSIPWGSDPRPMDAPPPGQVRVSDSPRKTCM